MGTFYRFPWGAKKRRLKAQYEMQHVKIKPILFTGIKDLILEVSYYLNENLILFDIHTPGKSYQTRE